MSIKQIITIAVIAIGLIASLFIKNDELRGTVQDSVLELHVDSADAGSEDASPMPEDATGTDA